MNDDRENSERLYKKIAVLSGLYSLVSVYLLFATAKYFFQNDGQYFDIRIIAGVMIGALVYGAYCYRTVKKLDGLNSRGLGWKLTATQVNLPERKKHRRFG